MQNNQNISYSLNKILSILEQEEKILVVVGKRSFIKNYFYEKLFLNFSNKIYLFQVKDAIPLFKTAKFIYRKIKNKNIKSIIAIGGGTVMDISKLVKLLYLSDTTNLDLLQNSLILKKNKKVQLIVNPTTAGSGAEATQFCVSYHYKKKSSISNPIILPNYVFYNPISLLSNSNNNKLSSGLDAFSQCIESLLSCNSSKESSVLALKGLKLILKNFDKYLKIGDIKSAKKMQYAAHLSGQAINISKTSAPHAFSYYLTSYYRIPHGFAVAIFLPYFFDLLIKNKELIFEIKVKNNLKKILKEMNIYSYKKSFFIDFYRNIGFYKIYLKLINNNYDISSFIKHINVERMNNFPLDINKYKAKDILKNIFRNNNI